jgi:KH domain
MLGAHHLYTVGDSILHNLVPAKLKFKFRMIRSVNDDPFSFWSFSYLVASGSLERKTLQVGSIIGKGGQMIKDLQARSGAHILV